MTKEMNTKEELAKELRENLIDEALIAFEPFKTDETYDRLLAEILKVLESYKIEKPTKTERVNTEN